MLGNIPTRFRILQVVGRWIHIMITVILSVTGDEWRVDGRTMLVIRGAEEERENNIK